MRVIGTAGHVDHGKSSLVAALTGIHPDRLKEEQAREMTIDLGFAWLTLPNGEEIGIVDVPGHRDFIENMLAGIGGIDAVLLVVAADEGVMPQTREHLAILNILQIQTGIIVLTKVDLIDDPEWLELIKADIRQAVQGTVLNNAEMICTSTRTGVGLDDLKKTLVSCLAERPHRMDLGRPRLPVDRVFTITGFGTVVTGTLLEGKFQVGDEVEVLPTGLKGRIRGLQTHKQKEDTAVPGSRTAVNISGLDVEHIKRGDVLAHPGIFRPSNRIDVHFYLLPDASKSLKHGDEVKFFLGAGEILARVRLLGKEELRQGEEGWLQLELHQPVVSVRGDRYILRRPSPGETLGGGSVVDPHPGSRYRRFSKGLVERLEALQQGTPAEVLLQTCISLGAAPIREAVQKAHLSLEQAQEALEELISEGHLYLLEEGRPTSPSDLLIIPTILWQADKQKAMREVEQFHCQYPLRCGMPREELKSRLKFSARLFNCAMRRWIRDADLVEQETWVFRRGHTIQFNSQQQTLVEGLLAKFNQSPFSPPTIKECRELVGEDVYNALVELKRLLPVSTEVVYRKEDFEALLDSVRKNLEKEGTLTVAQFRDRYNTSRRYALAFLEYLDSIGETVREGDIRKLRKK